MTDFTTIAYLKNGSVIQQRVYELLTQNRIMERLLDFEPILAGTFPIGLNVAGSDLDLVCRCTHVPVFEDHLYAEFGQLPSFRMYRSDAYEKTAVVAQFDLEDFPVEIFGQDLPSIEQNAYRHMCTEHAILQERGDAFRQQILELKQNGMKTEPAFGKLLQLHDPYVALLDYETVKNN